MHISSKSVCSVMGWHPNTFMLLRKTLKPDLGKVRNFGPRVGIKGRGKILWAVGDLIKWLDKIMSEPLDKDTVRRLMEQAELIR